MSKLVKVTKTGLLSLAVLAGLALLGLSLPLAGGQALSVQTGSMEPTISPGDLVFVRRVPVAELQVGDIVTYVSPAHKKQTITHRIVDLPGPVGRPKHVVLKGDANSAKDAPVSTRAVLGKQVTTVPYAGRALDFLRSWTGIILFVYIPALAVAVVELRKLIAYYRSLEPYVLPEILARRKKQTSHALRNGLAAVLALSVGSVAVAIPVTAALQTNATQTGNTIATATVAAPPVAVGGVSLRRVFVSCTPTDQTKPDHLDIILYNGTLTDAAITGWYLQTGTTKLFTFPSATSVRHRSTADVTAPMAAHISYGNGTLELRNAANQIVDTLSWSHIAKDRSCQVL